MYKIIVARNANNGIGVSGRIPWKIDHADLKHFRKTTMNQIVIMGRKTWESLPKALESRINIVLTSRDISLEGALSFSSINAIDQYLNQSAYASRERWVIGGEQLYGAYLHYGLVSDIFLTQLASTEECDTHFNWDTHSFELISKSVLHPGVWLEHYSKKRNPEEQHLLRAMHEILDTGFVRTNKFGVKTRTIFGKMFEYHMEEKIDLTTGEPMYRLPMLTTKKLFARGVFEELKWFLSGNTNSKMLEERGVNIWKGNTSREYLDKVGLTEYEEGEAGPIYGYQWRHWGAEYGTKNSVGIDQVNNVLKSLHEDPFSRRHIISGWNVSDLDKMCLPPCFPENAPVLTRDGYKEIQHVLDNDQVLSHTGTWQPIVNRQRRMYHGTMYKISHVGDADSIIATSEHPFLVKTIHMTSLEPLSYKLSGDTSWVSAENLERHKHVLCIPIIQEETPVRVTVTVDGEFKQSPSIDYFMVGYYVGMRGDMTSLQFIPPGWNILKEFAQPSTSPTCNTIPEWVQALPKPDLSDFIRGFESTAKIYKYEYDAINNTIALALQRIYAKLGILTQTNTINGTIKRVCDTLNGKFLVDDQYMYIPIQKIEHFGTEQMVYNLEIANDNSYTVANMAVHNCHVLYQFLVHEENGQQYLSLMMTQRSCDTFLGLPFNLCSLGMFLFLMAQSVDMKPHKIIHSIADMHIYEDHIAAVEKQLEREPYSFPYIRLCGQNKKIGEYEFSDIEIIDYKSHGVIKAPMIC